MRARDEKDQTLKKERGKGGIAARREDKGERRKCGVRVFSTGEGRKERNLS